MAAERATAAEMMAPAAAVVMVGVMLGLGRVGGGSGWRQRVSGTMSSVAAVQSSVAAVQSSVAAEAPGWCFFHIPPKVSRAVERCAT